MKLANFSLNHVGIFVFDIDLMTEFYTSFFGFVVTDGRYDVNPIRFLTMTPTEHHQLLLASGRPPGSTSTVHQISFLLDDFAQLRHVVDMDDPQGLAGQWTRRNLRRNGAHANSCRYSSPGMHAGFYRSG